MSTEGSRILNEVFALPLDERAELVDRILDSLSEPPDKERLERWAAETESRLDAIDRGDLETRPHTAEPMNKELSIRAGNHKLDLHTNKSDVLATFIRGAIGALPKIGPMAAEIIVSQIPNQKLERVVIFMKVLENRVRYLEDDVLRQKFMSEEFADLLEDGLQQASRALTNERKAYIANLLSTSLTDETLNHLAKKKLLSILNELNDAEVILLHYYGIRKTDQELADKMIKQHPFIRIATSPYSSVQSEIEEEVMFRDYKGKLVMTNLTLGTGDEERLTALGKLLLRYLQPEKI